jgi:hypothetical protein
MATYRVEVSREFKAWNDAPAVYVVSAPTAAKAISEARKRVAADMIFDRHDGRLTYTATRDDFAATDDE